MGAEWVGERGPMVKEKGRDGRAGGGWPIRRTVRFGADPLHHGFFFLRPSSTQLFSAPTPHPPPPAGSPHRHGAPPTHYPHCAVHPPTTLPPSTVVLAPAAGHRTTGVQPHPPGGASTPPHLYCRPNRHHHRAAATAYLL